MIIYEKVINLCREKGISLNKLGTASGIGRGNVERWDTISPSIDKVIAVADYFEISIDELVGHQVKASSISGSEKLLLDLFRGLNAQGKEKAISDLEFLSRQPELDKKNNNSELEA